MRTVSEEGEEDDEGDEGDEDDDDFAEDENHEGEEDDGGEDADIPDVAEAVDDCEDYNVYGKVKDEDEEEEDDMCFEDFKGTYGSEGGRSNANNIYVNQSFVSRDALVSELRLRAVRRRFSFRIYKSTNTLLVETCRVNGCGWKIRASVKYETNTFWVTKYVKTHTCSVSDRIAQRKQCTPFKGTYGSEGGRSNANNIYVSQSFVSRDALVLDLRLRAVRRRFSFRIYKSTKTLLVETCRVNGCGWKIRASVKYETNTFWVTKYVKTHTCSVSDRIAQRKQCTPKYIGRLFIDRVGIINGLNPQHITVAMKNMLTLDYTTSYKELLYAQELSANSELATYLANADVTLWLRVHCQGDKYNIKMSNIAESINSALKRARAFPIQFLLEFIREKLGKWFWKRRENSLSLTTKHSRGGGYGSEGGRSNANNIYVNQSFVSRDALVSELRLRAVRRRFSFRIYKSTNTLLVETCRVNGCGWKIRASVKYETNTFWVTKYVKTHTCSVSDRIAQRKQCTPKYIGRLFIDRVGIINGLNPQHMTVAMNNMFGLTLDYTTSYKALLYAQELSANPELATYLENADVTLWLRVHCQGDKYNIKMSNIAESTNSALKRARGFPIQFLLEFIREKLGKWFWKRRENSLSLTTEHSGKVDCVVDLENGKCDCGVYEVEKIPCSHAIAAGIHVSTLVCLVYSKLNFFGGYSENIYPCA
ncbi:hypothetical protein F2Q70_00002647 [Brassica cretica]|uniref:SWIM-type domain-containing protein n=1 Tax=Brassica cretica TaxID=69181 RepID=A0A8S9IT28_BRACR|nr:hypothetical protein F2Q70_00002647 [Brassica cretica]